MAGAVESFNLMCIAVSSFNRTAAMWLQPYICNCLTGPIHYLCLSKPKYHKVLSSQSDTDLEEPESTIIINLYSLPINLPAINLFSYQRYYFLNIPS